MEVSFYFLVCLVELPFQIKFKVEKCNEKKESLNPPPPPPSRAGVPTHLSQVLSLASSDPNLFFFIQQIELSSNSSLLFSHQEQHTLPNNYYYSIYPSPVPNNFSPNQRALQLAALQGTSRGEEATELNKKVVLYFNFIFTDSSLMQCFKKYLHDYSHLKLGGNALILNLSIA